jgi:hypothetical protein
MPDASLEQQNWSRMEPTKAAGEVARYVDKHERTLGWRHRMAQRGALAYSGAALGNLFDGLQPFDMPRISERKRTSDSPFGGWRNLQSEQHARAVCMTLTQKLTAEEPKTQLVGTDLEWEKRRQGVWADRFIEGNFHLQQGTFRDTWNLARHGFLLAACATGTVCARTEPDYVSKRVRTQLRSTLNTFVDPGDWANGQPLSFFDITWENPDYLVEDERFRGSRDDIWRASKIPPQHEQSDELGLDTKMVKMVSCWRMPFGKQKGRQAVFIGGKKVMWEDWSHPEPPLAFYRMNRVLDPSSFWAENFIEIMVAPLQDAEDIDDLVKNTMSRTSQTILSLDGTTSAPQSMLNARDVVAFRYDSKKGEKPPNVEKPGLLHSDYFAWRDQKISKAYALAGVSEMHAASHIDGANRSGRSIRLEAALLPERFAENLRDWRNWIAIDIAKNTIRAARQIGEVEPNWQVTWPGADFDAKVSVKVLDIDETIYELRPYAVSERKNTPADRAETAQEMFDRGQITQEQLSVILGGVYDTPKEDKVASAQRRYVAKVADEMLHGDEKVIRDTDRYMVEKYLPPPPWIDPPSALAQVLPQYLEAYISGVPQNRRSLLKRFVDDIWALYLKQQDEDAMRKSASTSVQATPGQAFPNAGGDLGTPTAGIGAPVSAAAAPAGGAAPMPPTNVGGMPGVA